jgi:hypothetical protein
VNAPRASGEQPVGDPVSVVTAMTFDAPPETVWNGLMFYEEIENPAPLHLRLFLPSPLRTEGRKSAVGDETRCIYRDGHLRKRVTEIASRRHWSFEIVEQTVEIGGAIRLSSGSYTLSELADHSTHVEIETRYVGGRNPRWLWRRFEIAVCHAFHRYLLNAIRGPMEREASGPCRRNMADPVPPRITVGPTERA